MHFEYNTVNTCSKRIEFDIEGNVITNVSFLGGCNGNLKAVSKLVDGMTVDYIEKICSGVVCGFKNTSCADQVARAVKEAYTKLQ